MRRLKRRLPWMTETVHGTLVIVHDVGVLLTGDSASGKSECALELLSRGHRLVADDVVSLSREGSSIKGNAPEQFIGLVEIRDIGVFDVRTMFGTHSFSA